MERMTPAKIKANHKGENYFDHKTMKFFGDRMGNYGVKSKPVTILCDYDENDKYVPGGVKVECWELYRKNPVKYGLKESVYFDVKTFDVKLCPSA